MHPELGVPDDVRRDLLYDELPAVCRACELDEARPRIPGQFLCEHCAAQRWGEGTLREVLDGVREAHGL